MAPNGSILQKLRYDGLFWRKFASLGSVYGPEWWRRGSPPAIAAIIFALIAKNRRGAIANLRQVCGSRGSVNDSLSALKMFVEFAYCVEETLELEGKTGQGTELGKKLHRELDIQMPPDFDHAKLFDGEHGLIVLTSHFGCWEMGARAMQSFERPVHLVMAREVNPTVEEFQRRNLERHGLSVIRSNASIFSSVDMIRALRRKEIVAIQLDRVASGQVTCPVEFFGRPAPFPPGPFMLARLSGAPLWPVFVVRTGRRRFRFLPEGRHWIDRHASEEETMKVMQDVVRSFEARVREYPHHWFQFAPFWDS